MIDPTKLAFFNIILYIIMLGYWQPTVNNLIMHRNIDRHVDALWFLIIIFCTYAGWDTDYEHYYVIFDDILSNPMAILTTHLESVYILIMNYCSFNSYSFFRLIVWGSAVILLRFTLKRLSIDNCLSACIFALFSLLYFSYARVSLAISLFLYGYILLLAPKKWKFLYIILGSICIFLSLFFHKSIVFAIILIPFSFIKLSQKKIMLSALLLPLICVIIKMSIDSFLSEVGDGDDLLKVQSAAQSYAAIPMSTQYGLPGMIIAILEKLSYFYGLYISWKYIYGKGRISLGMDIQRLFNISFFLFYISVVFMICNVGYVIERRIFLMSYLPLFFCISYCFLKEFKRKEFIQFSLLAFGFSFLKLCYFYYVYKVR